MLAVVFELVPSSIWENKGNVLIALFVNFFLRVDPDPLYMYCLRKQPTYL